MIKKQFTEGVYNIIEHDDGTIEKVFNPDLVESELKSEEELQLEKELDLISECLELSSSEKQILKIETNLNYIALLLEYLVQSS